MKKCKLCGAEKPQNEFHSGHARCKFCFNELRRNTGQVRFITEKHCSSCNEIKPIVKFHKNKSSPDGHNTHCASCMNFAMKSLRLKRKSHGPTIVRNEKFCPTCNSTKSIDQFNKKSTTPDGVASQCRKCSNEYLKVYLKRTNHNQKLPNMLRSVVNISLKNYKPGGKTKHTIEYGIDVHAIADAVGPKPSPQHHLDHIIPISAFDYNQEWQITASWHPKNLQWLLAEDNFRKGASFKENDLQEYLEWYKQTYLQVAAE